MNLSEYIIDFTIPQGPTGPTGPSDNFTRAFGYLCNQEKLILFFYLIPKKHKLFFL